MLKVTALFLLIFITINSAFSQPDKDSDSTKLKEVVVKAYFSDQPILKIPASVSVIGTSILQNQMPVSLVSAMNTAPGVRMEERSPGSYRLSIRGSLLRSPFGIRNVKIYMDDFLLTDAGGNTYLNLLDAGSVSKMEVIKGPEGSIFGANTGGVVLIDAASFKDSSSISAGITGGSYGLFHQKVSVHRKWKAFQVNMHQAYQRSDGYRENSKMDRKYVHLQPQWNYSSKGQLKALLMFSDLAYGTPGGLNLSQFEQNPRSARIAAGSFRGAVEQKAAISNKTILGGISNNWFISDKLKHVIAFTASKTQFKNPAISNYELRDERSIGIRSFLEYSSISSEVPLKIRTGFEAQQTPLDIERFNNEFGVKGDIQKDDHLKARQGFGFVHLSVQPVQKLSIESGLSINTFKYYYESFYPEAISSSTRKFKEQLLPRVAASYLLRDGIALRASISKGYSSPTLEEVNPSSQIINTTIQAETGWNREAGLRLSAFNNKVYWDIVYFNYRLKNTIVRGVKVNDTDYYINAGSTRQEGCESELIAFVVKKGEGHFINQLQIRNSFTYNYFKFGKYTNEGNDFSGNWLTGVPRTILVSSVETRLLNKGTLFLQHNYTSSLPLNDANISYAKNYHLVNLKASWRLNLFNSKVNLFAGADNLLNKHYSLGNDLNAVANRFYNAAASRNYYGGLNIQF